MSFVDARVIQARMAKKDARLAKEAAKVRAKIASKQTGHRKGDPECPATEASVNSHSAASSQAEEVPMTDRDPSTTPPVRTVPNVSPKIKPPTFRSYIREEMRARGWSRDRLALAMTAHAYGVNRLTVDFMLWSGGPKQGMVLGMETAEALATAFGCSSEFMLSLWESCHGHENPLRNAPAPPTPEEPRS